MSEPDKNTSPDGMKELSERTLADWWAAGWLRKMEHIVGVAGPYEYESVAYRWCLAQARWIYVVTHRKAPSRDSSRQNQA